MEIFESGARRSPRSTSADAHVYKLHVSAIRAVLEKLGINPSEAVYVGDRPWADVEGARHAGLMAVWINRSGRSWPDDLEPLPAIVASLYDPVDPLTPSASPTTNLGP